jgi:Ca-activated chloride channel family protein
MEPFTLCIRPIINNQVEEDVYMRKMVSKILSICMVGIILTSSLAGCGSKDSKNSKLDAKESVNYAESRVENDNAGAMNELVEYSYQEIDGVLYDEDFNTEEYNAIAENSIKSVKNYPISTFSADVDTASYSNVRRMINSGGEVVPDAVRIEEMINYFSYDYEKPTTDLPFSINTELSDCPWNENAKLLLVGLQAKEIDMDDRPSSNLVFLLDVSGSMYSEDKLPLMQKAFIMLTENLNQNDRISIVTYAGQESVVIEGARGDETMKIVSALEDLTAGGSTAGAAGIKKAYELANKYFIEGGNNRVILATDGDLNVGISSEGELKRLVEEKRETGVYLSVLGFGTGNIKDNKMETLADNGNGNYSYIDSILEAKKVLVEEMGGTLYTVAKDVKLQVEFNPAHLKGYRLIGYENRMLNTEDFEDDTKDAGEIGAGHRVTALYELIEVSSDQEVAETELKYQPETTFTDDNNEWLTVSIRYKEPDQDTSQLLSVSVDESDYTPEMSDNLLFASSVAAFGMLLRDSDWKGSASYQMILDNLKDQDFSNDEYKDEFISLVKKLNRIN